MTEANIPIDPIELALGCYAPRLWMWKLANPERCKPVKVKGRQGFWEWGRPGD
jgi:hypothetical protein